jgi:pyruvate,water dikinase
MTPLTYTVLTSFHEEQWSSIGNVYFGGNIGGRVYANVSAMVSLYGTFGLNVEKLLEEAFGRVPDKIEIPQIPLAPLPTLREAFPKIVRQVEKQRKALTWIPEYVATSPERCQAMRQRIQETHTKTELASLWREALKPYYFRSQWIFKAAAKMYLLRHNSLRSKLNKLVGESDANALLSNLSDESELLASLGPVAGIAKVARGEMNRTEFLENYGHRGPHECELSVPQSAEDPGWLDQRLEEYNRTPFDIDALLAMRRAEYSAAWGRFMKRYPRKAKSMGGQLKRAAEVARTREATRSEFIRLCGVIRAWALRAGALTGLDADIFFLMLDEVLDLLIGDETATKYIPTRRETYARYCALPPYPTFIRGCFDPFQWAADPDRRGDIYDAAAEAPVPTSKTISGFAGAAGRVEGRVRVLDGPEQGDLLQPGEILVAVTTNIGWTPLFPRAAAVVTDVGAPLSHAAIVARELGIPAVVGCGSATTRLRSGDRVRVDGGRGMVEILGI